MQTFRERRTPCMAAPLLQRLYLIVRRLTASLRCSVQCLPPPTTTTNSHILNAARFSEIPTNFKQYRRSQCRHTSVQPGTVSSVTCTLCCCSLLHSSATQAVMLQPRAMLPWPFKGGHVYVDASRVLSLQLQRVQCSNSLPEPAAHRHTPWQATRPGTHTKTRQAGMQGQHSMLGQQKHRPGDITKACCSLQCKHSVTVSAIPLYACAQHSRRQRIEAGSSLCWVMKSVLKYPA